MKDLLRPRIHHRPDLPGQGHLCVVSVSGKTCVVELELGEGDVVL